MSIKNQEELLEEIEWAISTVKNKLMFGMKDNPLQAAYARERRARGVLFSCKNAIKKLQKENELLRKELKEERSVVDYYGDTKSWVECIEEDAYSNTQIALDSNDTPEHFGGKRARQRIKERRD